MGRGSRFLDNIFRSCIKFLSYIYYLLKDFSAPAYINAAGKVLGHSELFKMIDASLDMKLIEDRFNKEFTTKLSQYFGVSNVLTVNSGASANLIAMSILTSSKLGARRLQIDDEVITIAAGSSTTINPIIQNRLIPVFVDLDPNTYNIDIEQLKEAINEKTWAVFIPHILGNPFNLDEVFKICVQHNLWLIEDNCSSLGSQYNGKYTGTFGHISTLSFDPSGHITTGEGGAILTNDAKLYKIAKSYRDFGHESTYNQELSNPGYNLKMSEWQAAIGVAQLNKLPKFIKQRKRNFDFLYNGLKDLSEYIELPQSAENANPSWAGFLITVKDNDRYNKNDLVKFLEDNKIETKPLFSGNILRQPVFINNNLKIRIRNSSVLFSSRLHEKHYDLLHNTDKIAANSFWVGVWPGITKKEIFYVIDIIKSYFEK